MPPLTHTELHQAAVGYSFERGLLVPTLDWKRIRAHRAVGPYIARLYEAAPSIDKWALPAFGKFRAEIAQQFEFLTGSPATGGLGVTVTVQADEPYGNAGELVRDLGEQRRLRIIGSESLGHEHPLLTPEECDMFRALHEAFGIALAGAAFDRHGSEAAWLRHSVMFGPLARQAMTTETRGQACALHYASVGALPVKPKIMLLPPRLADPDYEAWR